jgi:acetyl-CoA C-acetyltransferase
MTRKPYAAIIGAGRTKFGELWYENPETMIVRAGLDALESVDKGLHRRDIQACYLGSFMYQVTNKLGLVPGYISRELDLNIPMTQTEAACASSSSALHNACLAIKSGVYDLVLVGGFEKMTDRYGKIGDDLMFAADPHEFDAGFTFAGIYATMMVRYMYEFGRNDEKCKVALAQIAVKNHHHAINNPYAQFRKEINVEDVFKSPLVADPIRLLHCSPVSDGAVAVVLCKPEIAKKYTDNPIYIISSQQATDHVSLFSRKSIPEIRATKIAVSKALREAGITLKDIQIAEAHDCFTIEECLFMEDAGFYQKGEGWKGIYKSIDSFSGSKHIPYVGDGWEIFVNVGGGLKADGHPVGATGLRQVYECFKQMRNEAGENQVDVEGGIKYALCHNIGGSGGIANVHILSREGWL